MHNHFSDLEISAVGKMLGSDFNVRRNRAGNITVEYLPEFNECTKHHKKFWTLYYTQEGTYLWRRHTGSGYCFPLNGVGRKRIGQTEKWVDCYGKSHYWYPRTFDIKNCAFDKFFEAITYFIKYLKKYRGIDVKKNIQKTNIDVAVKSLATTLFTNKEYIEKCTDSYYFDWLDWFDNNYPVHTDEERNEFAKKIDDEYHSYTNKFFGKTIDYNELNDLVGALRVICDNVDTLIKNGNYKDYNYVLENVSRNITQAGKTLQGLVNEIYSNIK